MSDDARFAEVTSLDDLPSHILREAEHFFAVYKQLEEKRVEVFGWQGIDRAHNLIRKYAR